MGEPEADARKHLAKALEGDDVPAAIHLGAAGVFALLHLADAIKHGLRDIIYELRD